MGVLGVPIACPQFAQPFKFNRFNVASQLLLKFFVESASGFPENRNDVANGGLKQRPTENSLPVAIVLWVLPGPDGSARTERWMHPFLF
jgi:hypothetical protein